MGRHSQPLLQEQAYQHEACGSYLWSPSCPCGCRCPYSPCAPCSLSSPHTSSSHSPHTSSSHSPRPCPPHSPCPFCSSSTPSCQARPCACLSRTNCTPRACSPPCGPRPSGPSCCSPSSAHRPSSFQPVPCPG